MDIGTVLASVLPAVLLTQAATLLGRVKEIDLSLDQQCFFVGVIQASVLASVSGFVAVILSLFTIFAVLLARFSFGRRFGTNSLVVSIAVGLILIGLSFVLMWAVGSGSCSPPYKSWVTVWHLAALAGGVSFVVFVADMFVTYSQRVKIPVQPMGSCPRFSHAVFFAVAPAALLVTLASTLLAVHTESITLSSSHGFGILGATVAMLAYGRLSRATWLGLLLAIVYIGGLWLMPKVGGNYQSFVVPILSLAVLGASSLFLNRP